MKIEFEKILSHAEEKLQRQKGVATEDHLKLFKNFNKVESERLHKWHNHGASGLEVAQGRSHLLDALIQQVFQIADEEYREKESAPISPLTIIALGGYGRQEMNPGSDVDIMFLHAQNLDHYVDVVANKVLYMLWDIGFQVGHSVRSLIDTTRYGKEDLVSKTAMLESRYLVGDSALFDQYQALLKKQLAFSSKKLFLTLKIEEMADRHKSHGSSTLVTEPDVKEGVGALRDLHTLLWMSRVLLGVNSFDELLEKGHISKKEHKVLTHTHEFLLRIRNELHFIANKRFDFLSLEMQPKVAEALGYKDKQNYSAVEVFVREYYFRTREVQEIVLLHAKKWSNPPKKLTQILKPVLGWKRIRDGFEFYRGEIYPRTDSVFQEDPLRLLRLFRHLQKTGSVLSEELKDLIRHHLGLIDSKYCSSPKASEIFLNILSRSGKVGLALRAMHETGVLGRYLPEFGRITFMVQYDFYHKFTTDEHILRVVDNLDHVVNLKLPEWRSYDEVFDSVKDVSLLYLSLLLHDVGKGLGGGHSHKGAEMSLLIGERLGLSSEQIDQLYFLVEHHLTMTQLSQRRDITDDNLIVAFSAIVKNKQNLNMLHLLSFCDSLGTSTGVWTKWKEELLWQLYWFTVSVLEKGPRSKENELLELRDKQREFVEKKEAEISEDQVLEHFDAMPPKYIRYSSIEDITTHLKLVEALSKEKLSVDWRETDLGYSVVTVCAADSPGLFYKIAGTLSLMHLNILSAEINTREDGVVLDSFYVSRGEARAVPADGFKEKFKDRLLRVLNQQMSLEEELHKEFEKEEKKKKRLLPESPPKIKFDNYISESYTVVDVQGDDHIGFLYTVSRAIAALDLSIYFAKISTEKTLAYDVFYVGDKFGKKIESEDLLLQIKGALVQELTQKPAEV